MPSDSQKKLFDRLVTEKEINSEHTPEKLKAEFANLDTASASAWIERMLELEDKGKRTVNPPF
jgi:hypothetical protein